MKPLLFSVTLLVFSTTQSNSSEVPLPAQSSGYRVKRNTYGDEQVTPSTGGGAQITIAPPESAPVAVPKATSAPDSAPVSPPVQSSGYRDKRNTYGDEQVTPKLEVAAPIAYAPAEQAAEVIQRPAVAPRYGQVLPPARPSGY